MISEGRATRSVFLMSLILAWGCAETNEREESSPPLTLPDLDVLVSTIQVEVPSEFGPGFISQSTALEPVFEGWEFERSERAAATTGIFGDLDGDGRPEILFSGERDILGPGPVRIVSYDPLSDSLVRRIDLEETIQKSFFPLVAILDLDGDGIAELIRASESSVVQEKISSPEPLEDTGNPATENQSALSFADVDQDGLLDILLGDHGCEPGKPGLRVALQEGRKHWKVYDSFFPLEEMAAGYYGALLFPRPDEMPQMFVCSRPCNQSVPMPSVFIQLQSPQALYPQFKGIDPTPETALYKGFTSVSFGPLSTAHPMAVTVADLNQNGTLELFTPLDIVHALFDTGEGNAWTDLTQTYGPLAPGFGLQSQVGWGSVALDLDADGLEELITAHGPTSNLNMNHQGEHEIAAYWNGGKEGFHRLPNSLGLNEKGDWRALIVGDLDQDAQPDLVVGGVGSAPTLHLNRIQTPHSFFSLALQGTVSNPYGLGSRIKIHTSEGIQTRLMGHTISPIGTSTPLVFFGLPAGATLDRIVIQWPSGMEQELAPPFAEPVLLATEPAYLEITPLSRRISTESDEGVSVTFFPENMGVTSLSPHHVAIHRYGENNSAQVVEAADTGNGWVAQWTPPVEAGVERIQLVVDGETIGFSPKIFYTLVEEN